MSLTTMAADAVEDLGRESTPAEVFEQMAGELPPGKTVDHIRRALAHAASAGLIRRVRKGNPNGSDSAVFAPALRTRERATHYAFPSVFHFGQGQGVRLTWGASNDSGRRAA